MSAVPIPGQAPSAAQTPTTSGSESLVPAPAPGPTPAATTPVAFPEPTPSPKGLIVSQMRTLIAEQEPTPAPEPVAAPVSTSPAGMTAANAPKPTPTAEELVQIAPATLHQFSDKASLEVTQTEQTSTTGLQIEELQNTLTKKFTEDDWAALKEFRTQLPDIFANAFPDKATARTAPINIWGVIMDPVNAHKDARVSVVLMKFLRARHLSVRDARDMLIGTLRWRETFNIPATLEEQFPEKIFGNLGHLYGHDLGGRPVVYNIYGGNQDLKAVFGDVQRFIRWRVALMERSTYELDFTEIDQTLQIHDYEGVGLTSRDANSKAAAAEASNIFQAHYPELLYKKFFVNVPTILNWLFWAFKPVLSANTLAKMSVIGTGHHALKKALGECIDLNELPTKYGGHAKAF